MRCSSVISLGLAGIVGILKMVPVTWSQTFFFRKQRSLCKYSITYRKHWSCQSSFSAKLGEKRKRGSEANETKQKKGQIILTG